MKELLHPSDSPCDDFSIPERVNFLRYRILDRYNSILEEIRQDDTNISLYHDITEWNACLTLLREIHDAVDFGRVFRFLHITKDLEKFQSLWYVFPILEPLMRDMKEFCFLREALVLREKILFDPKNENLHAELSEAMSRIREAWYMNGWKSPETLWSVQNKTVGAPV